MSCRDILWYLVFSGSAVNYMLKISLNLVIVAMVVPRTNKASASAECDADTSLLLTTNTTLSNVTFMADDHFSSLPVNISVR